MSKKEDRKSERWPKDCLWPEPLYDDMGMFWSAEDIEMSELDEEGQDLLEVRDYYDSLVEMGRLNEDYTWNYEFDSDEIDGETWDDEGIYGEEPGSPEEFVPDIGEEYWSDHFEYEYWELDLSDHYNRLKIEPEGFHTIIDIQGILGYSFVNENLLRQAFTRRSFAVEYGLNGCNEELELIGDAVLNTIVTREIAAQLTEIDTYRVDAPFVSHYREGDLSKIRSHFVSGDYLSAKMDELGLSKYILYGKSEELGPAGKEDVMEALIGAVMVDSGWNWDAAEDLIDRLLCVHISEPGRFLRKSYFEIFNTWHQKLFGEIPDYTVDGRGPYHCLIRFDVPENEIGIRTRQLMTASGDTRSQARDRAAETAYRFVKNNGLWININDAGMVPDLENSINQLQELYQKKYLDSKPEYEFMELPEDQWKCKCICGGIVTYGWGASKTKAKKEAAYEALRELI